MKGSFDSEMGHDLQLRTAALEADYMAPTVFLLRLGIANGPISFLDLGWRCLSYFSAAVVWFQRNRVPCHHEAVAGMVASRARILNQKHEAEKGKQEVDRAAQRPTS